MRKRSHDTSRFIMGLPSEPRQAQKTKRQMKRMFSTKKMQMLTLMLLCGTTAVMAQNSAGDYSAGTTALATVTEEIAKYVPIMVKLCYAIAGVVAIVGAISVYIAMSASVMGA